jgi:glutamate racemase
MEAHMDNRPIGVFDSGVGGLTVATEISKQLKHERIIYFGDTARVPYGSKSKETIIKYSNQIVRFLLTKNVKAIVIACGTASSTALETLVDSYDIPIIGVVSPGAACAYHTTKNNRVGIIGTEGTIASKTYELLIQKYEPEIEVYSKACPLFVPLVEEGWIEDTVTKQVAARYLKDFKKVDIDTLVLGCTHYPLIADIIGKELGETVTLVNPAYETAKELKDLLEREGLDNQGERKTNEYYVSDRASKFEALAKRILNKPMLPVKQINIEEY